MANPEEAKGKEGNSAEVGPILKRAARLPEGKVKTGIAKAAVTTELIKGAFNMDASVEPEQPEERRERLIGDDPAAEPQRDEIIKDMPAASDGVAMGGQVFTAEPGALANVERQLSGRALSGNMVPPIPLPPLRVGEEELSSPITPHEIAAGKIRVAPDLHSAESGDIQHKTIIPGPDGPEAV